MQSPFAFGKVVGGDSFTNRTKELANLSSNFDHQVHTILISPRRWGKTSLVTKALQDYTSENEQVRYCKIDFFNIREEREFYEILAREVIKSTSSRLEEWIQITREFLKRITPRFSFGADPVNDFELSFDWSDENMHYEEILNLPERIAEEKGIKIIICMDEFQSLTRFNDPLLFQNRLRSAWQYHKNVVYCFYGSKKSMMTTIFQKKSMPFYKFGQIMYLEKIGKQDFSNFIKDGFKRTDKLIEDDQVEMIVDYMQCHPYYVQQFAHYVWVHTEGKVRGTTLITSLEKMLQSNALLYEREVENLSNSQFNYLKALVGGEEKIGSQKTIDKFRLGSTANIAKIQKALLKKEIIDKNMGSVEILDPAFAVWFKYKFIS